LLFLIIEFKLLQAGAFFKNTFKYEACGPFHFKFIDWLILPLIKNQYHFQQN